MRTPASIKFNSSVRAGRICSRLKRSRLSTMRNEPRGTRPRFTSSRNAASALPVRVRAVAAREGRTPSSRRLTEVSSTAPDLSQPGVAAVPLAGERNRPSPARATRSGRS